MFIGQAPDGHNGKQWTGIDGVVGLDMLARDVLADGMNDKGLAAGLFYHPGFAEYMVYEPGQSDNSITAVDMVSRSIAYGNLSYIAYQSLITRDYPINPGVH